MILITVYLYNARDDEYFMDHIAIWGLGIGRESSPPYSPPLPNPPLVINGKSSHPYLIYEREWVRGEIEG